MGMNGYSHESSWTGWATDEKLRKYCIHLDVARSVFDDGDVKDRREFETPEQMFAYAEMLRQQHQPTSPARLFERGVRILKKFMGTSKKGE